MQELVQNGTTFDFKHLVSWNFSRVNYVYAAHAKMRALELLPDEFLRHPLNRPR